MPALILATRNPHKTREFAEVLGAEFEISDLTNLALPETEETGQTFTENAILKAEAASRVLPGFVVADDSGLEVEALAGAPGIYSARYAGEAAVDRANVDKLLCEMHSLGAIPRERRRARFVCAIALAENGKILSTFAGEIEGFIAAAPKGARGFGYDPVFEPDGYEKTFAELADAVKNAVSHRAIAIKNLRTCLITLGEIFT